MPSTSSDDDDIEAAGAMGDVDDAEAYRREHAYDPRPDFVKGFQEARPDLDKLVEVSSFTRELQALLNKYSADNLARTPDFILAKYLIGCLGAYTVAVQELEVWRARG